MLKGEKDILKIITNPTVSSKPQQFAALHQEKEPSGWKRQRSSLPLQKLLFN